MLTSKCTKTFGEKINIKNFTYYALIMYAIFLTFARVQTVAPSYFIAIIIAIFLLHKKSFLFEVDDKND